MQARLTLEDVRLRLFLGVLPSERLASSTVSLDLEWTGSTDPSDPAVDYAEVCRELASLEGGEYGYVEEVACKVLNTLCRRFGGSWRVKVRKPHPPTLLPVSAAEVLVEGAGD